MLHFYFSIFWGAVFLFFFFSTSTHALTIGPSSVVLKMAPGEKKTVPITILNETAVPLSISLGFNTEKKQTNGGSHVEGSPSSWFSSSKEHFQLNPFERTSVKIAISTPKKIAGGGYTTSLFWLAQPVDQNEGAVAVRQLIPTTITVDILGSGRIERAELLSFRGKQSALFLGSPIELVSTIRNDGNAPVKPIGEVRIKNIFGQNIEIIPFNKSKMDIGYITHGGGVRQYDIIWNNPFAFGKYSANFTAHYGIGAAPLSASFNFFVLPSFLFLLTIFIICAAFFMLVLICQKYFFLKKMGRKKK